MNLKPENPYYFKLLYAVAKDVHSAVIDMHVRLACPDLAEIQLRHQREKVAEVKALVRGVRNLEERREVVNTIRTLFHQRRADRGTESRWQDYMAKVHAARRERGMRPE